MRTDTARFDALIVERSRLRHELRGISPKLSTWHKINMRLAQIANELEEHRIKRFKS